MRQPRRNARVQVHSNESTFIALTFLALQQTILHWSHRLYVETVGAVGVSLHTRAAHPKCVAHPPTSAASARVLAAKARNRALVLWRKRRSTAVRRALATPKSRATATSRRATIPKTRACGSRGPRGGAWRARARFWPPVQTPSRSECSKQECGGGVRTRERALKTTWLKHLCIGSDNEEGECNTDCCPVLCKLSEWSEFSSECSSKCK